MTKNSYLKQEIRTRMARTGESYSVAAQAIGRGEPLPEQPSKPGDSFIAPSSNLVTNEDLLFFAKHVAMLLGMGFDLPETLEFTAEKAVNNRLKDALNAMKADLDSGKSLFEATSSHPTVFSKVPLSLIKKIAGNRDLSSTGHRLQAKSLFENLTKYYTAEMDNEAKGGNASFRVEYQERVPLPDLIQFTENLGHMLSTGISFGEAFAAIEGTIGNDQLRSAIQAAIADIREGNSPEVALAKHPLAFPGIFVPMLAAHNDSMNFSIALEKIAKSYRTELELQRGSSAKNEMTFENNPVSIQFSRDRAKKPRVAFIGPSAVGETLARMKSEWRFICFSTIQDFRDALELDEVSNDITAILIVDHIYDEGNSDEFSRLTASMAPYCFFAVISYNRSVEDSIRDSVADASYNLGYSTSPEIYFVDHMAPNRSLDTALEQFSKNITKDNRWAADKIFEKE